MISIIIPIFNAENYLKRMLESILGQSYQKFECILIDDGSSDSSYSICKAVSYTHLTLPTNSLV